MLDTVGRLGRATRERTDQLGAMLVLGYAALKGFALERRRGRRQVLGAIASQIYFTIVEPLPFFALSALIFGFVIVVECDQVLLRYHLHEYVPQLVVNGVIREVSPLIVAMILIGRSGPAIATELGYMKLNREVDALALAGVNLDYFLVLPRVVGVTIATIVIIVLTAATALAGGFVLGRSTGLVSPLLLPSALIDAISVQTILYAVIKATIFGATIALANCHHGLAVSRSFTEVPKANVRGAQASLVVCFVANALISVYAIL